MKTPIAGIAIAAAVLAAASAYLKNHREVSLRLRFTLGPGQCTFFTCDLTYEYVRLNADYTT